MTVIGFFTAADSVNKKQADVLSRVHDAYQKAGIRVYGVGSRHS